MSCRGTPLLLCALSLGLAAAQCPAGAARADGMCLARPAATDPVLLQTKATAALQRTAGHADEEVLTDADAEAAAKRDCSGPIMWHGSKCVDVSGGQSYNGAPVQTWDCQQGNGNQQFLLPAGGSGTIRWASNPGKCLDAKSGQIALWDCNSGQSQQFTVPTGDSGVFRSALGRCFDVPWGSTSNGARLQVWDCNPGQSPNPNQVFTNPCPAAAEPQQPQPSQPQPPQDQPTTQPQPQPQPQNGRKGSFLVFGDWGFDYVNRWHGAGLSSDKCQRLVASRMAQEMDSLGDVKFVINVGDSFYPSGVKDKSDAHWDVVWRNIYSAQLRSVPWYSIYGNHDLHSDPGTCSWDNSAGAQLNSDLSNRNFFYMPSPSYYAELPELDVEIIAVDQNYEWHGELCKWVPQSCQSICPQILKARNDQGFTLFHDRVQNSQAKNLIVVTHYPTDFCQQHEGCASFKDALRQNAKGNLAYFTGHTHVTQPMRVRDPSVFSNQPNAWLAGGGGGWSTEGDQGFIVGQIAADGTLTTYPVLINSAACK